MADHATQLNSEIISKKRKTTATRNVGKCITIDKIVGSGTFGLVFKGFELDTGVAVALKKIKMERETQGFPVTAIREIKILSNLKHVNIVDLREIMTYSVDEGDENEASARDKNFMEGDVFMVFEFVDYDLSGLLKSSGVNITERHMKSFLYQLLKGVDFLHSKRILHRDIKSANLLVTRGNVLKIADWGLARYLHHGDPKTHRYTTPVVTLWYRSPELILGSRHYSTEIDIWSVG